MMMKKLLLILLLFPFYSCVDKDFDLGKIDDSDIVFGNEFIAPLGTIELDAAKLFTGDAGASGKITIPDQVNEIIHVDAGLEQDILDLLSEGGTQSIYAEVKNPLNVAFNVKISFPITSEDGTESMIELVNGEITSGTSLLSMGVISKEVLEQFSKTSQLKIDFEYLSGDKEVTLDGLQQFDLNLKLLRKGGIKF